MRRRKPGIDLEYAIQHRVRLAQVEDIARVYALARLEIELVGLRVRLRRRLDFRSDDLC